MYAIVEPREPDYSHYTYEEHNVRLGEQVYPHAAPDPVRQSANAPVKPATQQIAVFYDHSRDNLGGDDAPNSLGPVMLGSHVLIGRNASWTQSPRGALASWGDDRPIDRDLPETFGSQVEPIAGGKF